MTNESAVENGVASGMSEEPNELSALTSIVSQISKFDVPTRERILHAVAAFCGISIRVGSITAGQHPGAASAGQPQVSSFSEDRSISPKQFMLEKQPRTDVEKVACLAYYLTHYRDTPYFKTLDISKLNTEAAQVKFSNPTVAVDNAVKTNYLVPATKGNRQISASGEQFVQALPDRDKAKAIMANLRPRRRARKSEDQSEEG